MSLLCIKVRCLNSRTEYFFMIFWNRYSVLTGKDFAFLFGYLSMSSFHHTFRIYTFLPFLSILFFVYSFIYFAIFNFPLRIRIFARLRLKTAWQRVILYANKNIKASALQRFILYANTNIKAKRSYFRELCSPTALLPPYDTSGEAVRGMTQ